MSPKTNSSKKMSVRTRSVTPMIQELYKNRVFLEAVNKAADIKCLHAIRTGRLRLAVPTHLPQPFRYIPRMDLIDDPSSPRYLAIFEVPGMKSESMSLSIRDGHLVIMGERKSLYPTSGSLPQNPVSMANAISYENNVKEEPPTTDIRPITAPVQELRFGAFHRAIPVPNGIKDSDVTASIMDGMLTVTWPKSAAVVDSSMPDSTSTTSNPPMPNYAAGTASR